MTCALLLTPLIAADTTPALSLQGATRCTLADLAETLETGAAPELIALSVEDILHSTLARLAYLKPKLEASGATVLVIGELEARATTFAACATSAHAAAPAHEAARVIEILLGERPLAAATLAERFVEEQRPSRRYVEAVR